MTLLALHDRPPFSSRPSLTVRAGGTQKVHADLLQIVALRLARLPKLTVLAGLLDVPWALLVETYSNRPLDWDQCQGFRLAYDES